MFLLGSFCYEKFCEDPLVISKGPAVSQPRGTIHAPWGLSPVLDNHLPIGWGMPSLNAPPPPAAFTVSVTPRQCHSVVIVTLTSNLDLQSHIDLDTLKFWVIPCECNNF